MMSAMFHLKMIGAVNASLPPERQFAAVGWHLARTLRLQREYRALFPGEKLLRKWKIAVTTAFVSLLIGAWSLGFFGH